MRPRAIVTAITLIAGSASIVHADLAGQASSGRASIEFIVKRGPQMAGSFGMDLKPDDPPVALFTARQSLCEWGIGTGHREPAADARTVIRLSADLIDQTGGVYRVRLASQRLRTNGQPITSGPAEQVVSMHDGDDAVMEFLRDTSAGCNTTALAIAARLVVTPEAWAADALFAADLWLSQKDGGGHESTQHVTMNVNGSTDVPFIFGDVEYPLPRVDSSQSEFAAFIRMTGSIKARLRSDGQIDVDLSTKRNVGLTAPGRADLSRDGFGGGMRKELTLADNAATEIAMPAPTGVEVVGLRLGDKVSGQSGGGVAAGTLTGSNGQSAAIRDSLTGPPVYVSGSNFVLNMTGFFKDYASHLTLRLRRIK